ncbi:hypothetical protein OIDMADRAFT_33887 [Oidiodendron maius Zn]|uniref:Uncharacterized protein n=1 Tax=Oidiodendron maius (strain Zn) TaxID=913774 RepID=A0A0C3GZX3_OIDMZ|nr:hypothetical protein OIDMADRAFT_33887 [Oidiodendron maius Zn]
MIKRFYIKYGTFGSIILASLSCRAASEASVCLQADAFDDEVTATERIVLGPIEDMVHLLGARRDLLRKYRKLYGARHWSNEGHCDVVRVIDLVYDKVGQANFDLTVPWVDM